jgi:hypothetical protein
VTRYPCRNLNADALNPLALLRTLCDRPSRAAERRKEFVSFHRITSPEVEVRAVGASDR